MTHTTFSIRRVLCTFGVSGNGQVLYMSSASEIQRMSLAKDDRYTMTANCENFVLIKEKGYVSSC